MDQLSNIVDRSSYDSQKQLKNSEMKHKQFSRINLLFLTIFCVFIEYLCLVEIHSQILAFLTLSFFLSLILLRLLQDSILPRKKRYPSSSQPTQNQNKADEETSQSSNIASSDLLEFFKDFLIDYHELLFSCSIVGIYICIFEILITYKKKIEMTIIISYFLTLASHTYIMSLKNHLTSIVIVCIQQIYTIVQLQLSEQFDSLMLLLNILYFMFQISLLNAIQTSKKRKSIQKREQKIKLETITCLYQSILSIIPEGIAVINSEKKLLYANPPLKRILKTKRKEEIQSILMSLGRNQVEPPGRNDNKNIQKLDENPFQGKKSIDVQSGISKNREDPTQKHDVLSTNYSEIAKYRKRDTFPFAMPPHNEKPQNINKQSGKSEQISARSSINIQEPTIYHNRRDSEIVKLCPDVIGGEKESVGKTIILNQQIQQDVAKQSQEGGEKRNSEIIFQQNQERETKEREQNKQFVGINNQLNLLLKSESENFAHNSRSYQIKQQATKNVNALDNLSGARANMMPQQFLSSGQFISDQSEIISYSGFGISFFEEDKSLSKNHIHSCNLISHFKSNDSVQNKPTSFQPHSQNKQQQQFNYSTSSLKNGLISQEINAEQHLNKDRNNHTQIEPQDVKDALLDRPSQNLIEQDGKVLNQNQSQKQNEINGEEKILANQPSNQININICSPFDSKKQFISQKHQHTQDFCKKEMKTTDGTPQTPQWNYYSGNKQPFSLRVKEQQTEKTGNQIQLEKIDVGQVLNGMFQNISNEKQACQEPRPQNERRESQNPQLASQRNSVTSQLNNNMIKNNNKRSSFISQLKQRDTKEEGLTYIQQTDNVTKLEAHYRDKDLVIQFLSVDVVQKNSNKNSLALVMVQDIWSELYQKKVQDSQKEKMKVFATLSHELRTPLNCSISMLEVLKDEISMINSSYIEEYLNPALFSNKLLLNQINDILDFVQMDSGKFKYSFLDFNILSLLKDCQKLVSMQAKMKNIEIKVSLEQSVPDSICSDPNRIRQIILNFLSNSLKFTKQGYIEIGVKLLERGIYKLFVKDTGIGIKQDDLNRIFNFCTKINYCKKDQGLNTQGCGLGLTISDSIAKGLILNDNLRGGIQVESEYGEGSTFSIFIQDMNDGEHFSHYANSNEATKMFIKISSKDMDNSRMGKGRSSTITPLLKKRFDPSPQDHIRSIQKKNINQYLTNQQVIIEDEQSMIDANQSSILSHQIQFENQHGSQLGIGGGKSLLVNQGHSKLTNLDSTAVIDAEEDENSKRYQFERNLSINNHDRFQEEQPDSFLHNNFSQMNAYMKTPSIQYKQIESIRQLEPRSNQQKSDYFLNIQNDGMGYSKASEQQHIVSQPNEETKSNQSLDNVKKNSNLSLNFRKLISNGSMRNEVNEKQLLDQEGFTSYVPCYKYGDVTSLLSQNQIFSCTKIMIPKMQASQMTQKTVSEEKTTTYNPTSINLIDPQQAIDQIIVKNSVLKSKCSCPQILIVDDNQFNLYALSKTIQHYQFQCEQIGDSTIVLSNIKQMFYQSCCKSPKLIFMDIEMPFKNGYEVAMEIQEFYKSVQYEQAPIIIACTAYVGQEDHDKAIQSGMKDFINKPILKSAFQQLIINWQDLFL